MRYDHHPASERGGVGTRGLPTWCYEWVTSYNGYYYLGDHMLSNYYGPLESNLAANYVYVNGERIGMFRADDTVDVHYYLTDHLGSVTGVVRRDGFLENKYVYRPFGEKLASSHSVPNKYHYTSQELDPEFAVDWYYYGARYYDPELKIFTSVDPAADRYPAWGPYVYTKNNPIKYVDPDGELVWLAVLAAAAYIVLTTPDYAHAPAQEGEHVEMTFGEEVVQWGTAITGAWGIMKAGGAPTQTGAKQAAKSGASQTVAKESLVGPKGGTSWSTARRTYWKGEATMNPGKYSKRNLERMEKGSHLNALTGRQESLSRKNCTTRNPPRREVRTRAVTWRRCGHRSIMKSTGRPK